MFSLERQTRGHKRRTTRLTIGYRVKVQGIGDAPTMPHWHRLRHTYRGGYGCSDETGWPRRGQLQPWSSSRRADHAATASAAALASLSSASSSESNTACDASRAFVTRRGPLPPVAPPLSADACNRGESSAASSHCGPGSGRSCGVPLPAPTNSATGMRRCDTGGAALSAGAGAGGGDAISAAAPAGSGDIPQRPATRACHVAAPGSVQKP
mmetsp:Transcript_11689/g.34557  ORF Transcript_11689/g.34557 Transcript_11689/m.34557 type:complete len:211 (-) Transcript_11689:112-744(-)